MIGYEELTYYKKMKIMREKDIRVRIVLYTLLGILYITNSLLTYPPLIIIAIFPIATYIMNIAQLHAVDSKSYKGIRFNDISILLISYLSFMFLGIINFFCFGGFIFLIIIYLISTSLKKRRVDVTFMEAHDYTRLRNVFFTNIIEVALYIILITLGFVFTIVVLGYSLEYLGFGLLIFVFVYMPWFIFLSTLAILTFYFALTFNIQRSYKKYFLKKNLSLQCLDNVLLKFEAEYEQIGVESKDNFDLEKRDLESDINVQSFNSKQKKIDEIIVELYTKEFVLDQKKVLETKIVTLTQKKARLTKDIVQAEKRLETNLLQSQELEHEYQKLKEMVETEQEKLSKIETLYGLPFHKERRQRVQRMLFKGLLLIGVLLIGYQLYYIHANQLIDQVKVDELVEELEKEDYWFSENQLVYLLIKEKDNGLSKAEANQVLNAIELKGLTTVLNADSKLVITEDQIESFRFLATLRVAINDSYFYHYNVDSIFYDGKCLMLYGKVRSKQYIVDDFTTVSGSYNNQRRSSGVEFEAWLDLLDQTLYAVNPDKYPEPGNIKNGIEIISEWSSRSEVVEELLVDFLGNKSQYGDKTVAHLDWSSILTIVISDQLQIIDLENLYNFGAEYTPEEGAKEIDKLLGTEAYTSESNMLATLNNRWNNTPVPIDGYRDETVPRIYVFRKLRDYIMEPFIDLDA